MENTSIDNPMLDQDKLIKEVILIENVILSDFSKWFIMDLRSKKGMIRFFNSYN